MPTRSLFCSFVCCSLLLLVGADAAAQTIRQCVVQANKEASLCRSDCEQTRKDAVLNCRVPSGDCGDTCKAAYQGCAAPFETERETCLDDCDTTFQNSRTSCATQCSCELQGSCGSSACFGSCIFGPAVDKAVCKVTCYRNNAVKTGLSACRQALRACGRTCD